MWVPLGVREREALRLGESVYKVGMTVQVADTRIKRIEKYKKGSEIVGVWRVKDSSRTLRVESEIKGVFTKTFQRHPDGHEFFIGDENRMVEIINKLVGQCNTKNEANENVVNESPLTEANKAKKKYECTLCKRVFPQKSNFDAHLNRKTPCNSTSSPLDVKQIIELIEEKIALRQELDTLKQEIDTLKQLFARLLQQTPPQGTFNTPVNGNNNNITMNQYNQNSNFAHRKQWTG